jgi:hypothetical protein
MLVEVLSPKLNTANEGASFARFEIGCRAKLRGAVVGYRFRAVWAIVGGVAGLHLHTSNRLERLFAELAGIVSESPGAILQQSIVVVQTVSQKRRQYFFARRRAAIVAAPDIALD